jgi:hypothetical protein
VSPHPYTDLAFEGFHFAKEHGKGSEYHTRVFQAFFQEEQNISTPNDCAIGSMEFFHICRLAGSFTGSSFGEGLGRNSNGIHSTCTSLSLIASSNAR